MKISKIALMLFVIPFAFILAQDFPAGDANKNLDKIAQLENAKLIQVLNLNEETAVRFFTRRKEYRDQQKNLLEKRHHLIESVEELLKGKDKDNTALYKEKLDELISIETDLVKEKKNFYKSLGKLLSVKQLVQLALFEDKFRREMRETLMKRGHNEPGK